MRARSTWNSCFISVQSLYLIFSFWCFLEQLRKRRLSTFHATANPRPSPVSLNFLRCTPSHQKTMKKVQFLQISWTLTSIYNMRFTFPWVFVENTPHLIWIKPEPHTHSLPPWPCNGWANVFTRHQKCISRRKKCIFFWIFPTLFSSFTVVVVGKSETCRLSASISWDAFRKGWERLLTAWTHINISFLSSPLTCWLTKTEEFRPYNSLYIWCLVHTIQIPAKVWREWTAAGNLDPGKICKNRKSATAPKPPASSRSATVATFSAFAICLSIFAEFQALGLA